MDYFDKRMAFDVIEDALTNMNTPHGRGVATGLCGAFYMCGLLSVEEWEAFLERIPAEFYDARTDGICGARGPENMMDSRALN
jgi:hypothetical protein